MQQQSSRRLNQLVGGKDTICRKHNQNREPKCNFTITTLSRTNKVDDTNKKFTIPRNSVFIAVNDSWATQEFDSTTHQASGSGREVTNSNAICSSDEKKRYRQPVIKAESLPQYCDRTDSIERKSLQRRSSNETGGTGICYATFSKGMYKPQHIYENDCIIRRPSIVGRGSSTNVLPCADDTDDNATAANATAPNHPLYAVVNKNNKSKNKQSNELQGIPVQHQPSESLNCQARITTAPTTAAITTHLMNNNNHHNNNSNSNAKLRGNNSHPSSSSNSSSCSTSDIMGNMLQNDSTLLDVNPAGGFGLDHQHHQGAVNKATHKFDPIITTTTITADALKSDSNAEHSIYAKVWKGPRKTSESKMYANFSLLQIFLSPLIFILVTKNWNKLPLIFILTLLIFYFFILINRQYCFHEPSNRLNIFC